MTQKKILMAGSLVAGALLLVAGPASAQSLSDVGTGFKNALMRDAKACKQHLTGFNLASVKNTFKCFVNALKNAAKAALLGLARAGWNTVADMLASKGGPAAQKALGSLLNKVGKLIPGLTGVSRALQGALGAGAKHLATGVKACGSKITALNLGVLKSVFGCAVTALKGAAGVALLAAARNLFDEAVAFLKTSPAKAKSLFSKLAGKLPVPAGIKNAVINGIGAGAAQFADSAATCRQHITEISGAAAKATFSCLGQALKGALKSTGLAIARNLFDEAVGFLKTSPAKAKQLFTKLTAKLPVPASIKNAVLGGIKAGAGAFADQAATCRKFITELSGAAAKATFGCVANALKGALKAAGVEIVRSLFDQFTSFVQRNCTKAADKLGALASKVGSVFRPARGLAANIGTALKAACNGVVDKVASLNPVR